jgi:hypothetical protein
MDLYPQAVSGSPSVLYVPLRYLSGEESREAIRPKGPRSGDPRPPNPGTTAARLQCRLAEHMFRLSRRHALDVKSANRAGDGESHRDKEIVVNTSKLHSSGRSPSEAFSWMMPRTPHHQTTEIAPSRAPGQIQFHIPYVTVASRAPIATLGVNKPPWAPARSAPCDARVLRSSNVDAAKNATPPTTEIAPCGAPVEGSVDGR